MRLGCQLGANKQFDLRDEFAKSWIQKYGWVAEWLKVPVLKTGRGSRSSWVRIPPHPPFTVPSKRIE